MARKIAVLVRERRSEALRMSLGLTLVDDTVDVYVLDGKLDPTEGDEVNLELMEELEMEIFTNHRGNQGMKYLSTDELALKLADYDHVIPY